MKINDLIAIGKLGNKLNSEGYIPFRKKEELVPFLLKTKDIFLLFTDHRVRYVTIENEQEDWLQLKENDITLEAVHDGNVQVLLAPEDYQLWNDIVQIEPYLNFAAWENNVMIGKICDYIYRPLQNLFEIELENGKTFYVPDVSEYVTSIDTTAKTIIFHNITELMFL
jgi:ribosomal 30S subunit maturation factor RimM